MKLNFLSFSLACGVALGAGSAAAAPQAAAMRYYPPAAQKAGVEGKAMINCLLAAGGLTDCRVVSESPEGYGFGVAAVQMSVLFDMRPELRDGQPVVERVTIPIDFRLPEPRPAPTRDFRDASRLPAR